MRLSANRPEIGLAGADVNPGALREKALRNHAGKRRRHQGATAAQRTWFTLKPAARLGVGQGGVQAIPDSGNHPVDLFACDDKGWRNDHANLRGA